MTQDMPPRSKDDGPLPDQPRDTSDRDAGHEAPRKKRKSSARKREPALEFRGGVRGRFTDIFRHDYTITIHHKTYDEVYIVRMRRPLFPLKDRVDWMKKGHFEPA